MRDVRKRFEALNLLEAPYQWPEIERRAVVPQEVRTPSWLHGTWVAAATAAALLIFAGGIVAGRWLLGAGSLLDAAFGGSDPLRPATPADVSVLALVVAGASGGLVMLTAALTLAWRWRKRNGQSLSKKTRGEVMETMEETVMKPEQTIQQVTRNNRWLILAVVVLFAALAALGAWLLVDNLVTSDVEQVVLDSNEAINAHDVDAYLALHSPDSVFRTVINGEVSVYEGEEELRSWFGNLSDSWYSDIAGDPVVQDQYVTFPNTVGWSGSPGYEGIHVVRVEDGLITERLFVGGPVSGS